jgi:outer membrane cobalamin receptor
MRLFILTLTILTYITTIAQTDTLMEKATDSIGNNIITDTIKEKVSSTNTVKTNIIKGKVTDDKDNSPLEGVIIKVKGTTNGAATDSLGKYEITVGNGVVQLECTYIGYETRIIDVIFIKENETKTANFKMSEDAQELEVVVVSSGKYEKKFTDETVSMEVLKGQTINQSSSKAEEAINYVPGVNMLGKNISIRGGGGFSDGAGSRVLVLLDDIPIVSPENGGVNFAGLPLEAMEQVEVIKGASSSAYGSSALNGTMNFRTLNAKPEMYNKILINIGFYDEPNNKKWSWWWHKQKVKSNGDTVQRIHRPMFGGFQFTHAKKYGNVDVVLSGAYQNDESFRYANRQTTIRGFGKIRYIPKKLQKLTMGVNFGVLKEDLEDFFIYWGYGKDSVQFPWPDYLWSKYGKDNTSKAIADSFIYMPTSLSKRNNLTINVDPFITYYDKHENRHSFKQRTYYTKLWNNSGSGDSSTSVQTYFDYSFTKEFKDKALVITTGVNYYYTTISATTFNNRTVHNAAAYFQFDKKFFKRLTLSAGLRLEYSKLDSFVQKIDIWTLSFNSGKKNLLKPLNSPVVPVFRVGLNYQASKGTFLRMSFGQGFRYPAIAEKYVNTVRNGIPVSPNPDLKPEAGWSSEIGIKQGVRLSRWMFFADISGFCNQYNKMIEFQGDTNNALAFKARNVPAVRILGTEISATGNGKIYGVPLNFIIGYTYLNPVNLSYNPDPNSFLDYKILKYRIEHSFKADISSQYKGFNFGIRCLFNSFMKEVDRVGVATLKQVRLFRENHNKGDFIMDVRAGYSWKDKVSFNLIAKNVTNREYTQRPGLVEAPRNYTFQVGYQF